MASLTVFVKEIVLDGENGDESLSMTVPGTFEVDVLAGTSSPALPDITLSAGTWESLNLGVEIDDDVSGRSAIELEAKFYGEAPEPTVMVYSLNSGEVFEIEPGSPVNFPTGATIDIPKIFHPSRWFPTVDLNGADVNDEGVIVLSLTSNSTLHRVVSDALDASTQNVFTDGTFTD